jgi:hypothetical protein
MPLLLDPLGSRFGAFGRAKLLFDVVASDAHYLGFG